MYESKMSIRKGEVYVVKGSENPTYALIVEGFEKGRPIVRDSSSRNTKHDFIGYSVSCDESDFLRMYERATPQQLERTITNLKEEQEVVARKIISLEGYAKSQTPVNVEGLNRATADILELNLRAQKISPIHTSEGVLGMGPLDSMDILGHGE